MSDDKRIRPQASRNRSGGPKLVCYCYEVPEEKVKEIIREHGVQTLDDLHKYCNAGLGCGTCRSDLEKFIADAKKGK